MEHRSFFPRSIRNRIALCLAILSLLLFFAWNFMPPIVVTSDQRSSYFVINQWIESFWNLKNFMQLRSIDAAPYILYSLMLFLHLIILLSIIPAWKFWLSSAIIRAIPAILFIITGLYLCNGLRNAYINYSQINVTFYLIAANFFTTALSLLCFKNEYTEPETQH